MNYVADEQGFRAEIKSNEPGVIEKDPASTTIKHIHSEVKKPVLYAAPAPAPVPAPTAAVIHHPYNPEFPLLYSSPYYAPISTYKGTPFRRYGVHPIHTIPRSFYKGTPFVSSPKGYYIYPWTWITFMVGWTEFWHRMTNDTECKTNLLVKGIL